MQLNKLNALINLRDKLYVASLKTNNPLQVQFFFLKYYFYYSFFYSMLPSLIP